MSNCPGTCDHQQRSKAARPDAGDVEALAWAINDAEDGGKTTPTYTELARHILASDWLAAHDAEVRRTAAGHRS